MITGLDNELVNLLNEVKFQLTYGKPVLAMVALCVMENMIVNSGECESEDDNV